ncbi:Elongator subunit elp4 [Coemansia thaxteri]|nr:Elongator subunit elp4 [Coemansia thaxteri]KAJ2471211.1 Elongator subunit elp4 [Coemansia sp. RSA 2322]KAJ2477788.1 Elongator subunit elp4 [Coemansia sp. RSA 2320]
MSSFRKRVPATLPKPPPGTRVNPHSAQLLVSTGVPALDDVLGGGLPVGGVLLVEQDRQTGYSNTLLSYFASQAVAAGHRLCIVDADREINPVCQLPGWANVSQSAKEPSIAGPKSQSSTKGDETMQIAWRYQNLPKVDGGEDGGSVSPSTTDSVPFCEKFDLSLRIPQAVIDRANIEVIDSEAISHAVASSASDGDMYKCVLDRVAALIDSGFSSLKPLPPNSERNILRIEVRSLGSAFWSCSDPTAVLKFLHGLRALLRYSYAVCMVSFPAYLYEDAGVRLPLVRRVEHLCDAVIELESFEGSHATPSSIVARQLKAEATTNQEYHGFVHIHKLPRLNSLTASTGRLSLLHTGGGSANNLAFRLRRKRFSIETYHLPIEGGVTERRVPPKEETTRSKRLPSGAGCGSTPGRNDPLEF